MGLNQIIIYAMVAVMVIAAADRIFGSRAGLGKEFLHGVEVMGDFAIPMVGMMILTPLIGDLIAPVVSPLFHLVGADPAMMATSILACDMGGYSLAYALADTEEAAQFSACILGCLLGNITTFMIPVGLNFVPESLREHYALGTLIGIISVPVGLFAGGVAAGYDLSMILHNCIPVTLFALLIAFGLWKAFGLCMKLFTGFGYVITALATAGFAIGIIQELTPLTILPDAPSILDGLRIVGNIAIVLCGAFPMVALINKVFAKPLRKIGRLIRADEVSVTAMLACTANVMPFLDYCKKMSPSGIAVAMAFCVGANSMFGDWLGFIASMDSTMIVPMIISNCAAAIFATPIAIIVSKKKNLSVTAQNK